jgi:ssDNA-binding Zn-finger/Zn-ribbon topoisomerase 1
MAGKKGFVCQNCGKNVPANTDKCPYCGRFFKGVRCPKCFFVGAAADFEEGCPSCGYLGNEPAEAFLAKKDVKKLPAWFYIAALTFLIAVIFVFILILRML